MTRDFLFSFLVFFNLLFFYGCGSSDGSEPTDTGNDTETTVTPPSDSGSSESDDTTSDETQTEDKTLKNSEFWGEWKNIKSDETIYITTKTSSEINKIDDDLIQIDNNYFIRIGAKNVSFKASFYDEESKNLKFSSIGSIDKMLIILQNQEDEEIKAEETATIDETGEIALTDTELPAGDYNLVIKDNENESQLIETTVTLDKTENDLGAFKIVENNSANFKLSYSLENANFIYANGDEIEAKIKIKNIGDAIGQGLQIDLSLVNAKTFDSDVELGSILVDGTKEIDVKFSFNSQTENVKNYYLTAKITDKYSKTWQENLKIPVYKESFHIKFQSEKNLKGYLYSPNGEFKELEISGKSFLNLPVQPADKYYTLLFENKSDINNEQKYSISVGNFYYLNYGDFRDTGAFEPENETKSDTENINLGGGIVQFLDYNDIDYWKISTPENYIYPEVTQTTLSLNSVNSTSTRQLQNVSINDISTYQISVINGNQNYYDETVNKSDSVEIFNLPLNTPLTFSVEAFNSSNEKILEGSTTQILTDYGNAVSVNLTILSEFLGISTPQLYSTETNTTSDTTANFKFTIVNPNKDTIQFKILKSSNLNGYFSPSEGNISFGSVTSNELVVEYNGTLTADKVKNYIELIDTEENNITEYFYLQRMSNNFTLNLAPIVENVNFLKDEENITALAVLDSKFSSGTTFKWSLRDNSAVTFIDDSTNPVQINNVNWSNFDDILDLNVTNSYGTNSYSFGLNGQTNVPIVSSNFKFLNIPQSFTRDNTNDIVTDELSGLKWEDTAHVKNTTLTYSNAETYCENLTLGGITDWRVPTNKEIWYLHDRSKYAPALNSTFNNYTTSDSSWSWTSTPVTYSGYEDYNWVSQSYSGLDSWGSRTSSNYLRCVSGTSNYEFEDDEFERDHSTNIVTDKRHNLMWQDDPSSSKYNYSEAQSYCSNLTLGGYSDWRLPEIEELYSIADQKRETDPFVNSAFQNVVSNVYWSNTTAKWNSSDSWELYFNGGYDDYDGYYRSDDYFVRCVR